MITLAPQYITSATRTFNGQTITNTTDTMRISYAELDLVGGSVMCMVERGTVIGGAFTPNMSKLRIQLNADGTFASTDGSWSGTVPVAVVQGFVSGLTSAFQQFVLGAGAVQGSVS